MQVINISTLSQPKIIGSVKTPGDAYEIAVAGNTVFVADGLSGLQVLDISTPSQPKTIGSVVTPSLANGVAVAGNTAFVACWSDGLQVIDVSTPSQPKIIGSVDTPGSAYGVAVAGNNAFVADKESGLQVIDISIPSQPKIIGSVITPGYANGVAVAGNTAFVADGGAGLVTVPLNLVTEIKPVTVKSETELTVTLPSPPAAGNWTLRVFSNSSSEYDELHGAVTFSESEKYHELRQQKAIIVAGSNSYPDNYLWDDTWLCTTYAYLSLLSQGYTRETVCFLSPDKNFDGNHDGQFNDVDDDATAAALQNALTVWAADAGEVLLYMSDHGGKGTFYLNENEILRAETLNGWLNTLQNAMPGKVIVIYDACLSGSFIPLLKPPSGKERVVITSSSADRNAYFDNSGMLSFSYQFWSYLFRDANLFRAFDNAALMMEKKQIAWLDANGDGIGYIESELDVPKEDKSAIKDIVIGRGWDAGSVPPVIKSVSAPQTLNGETAAAFSVGDITALNAVKRVWANILAPGYRYAPADQPITELLTVEMRDSNGDGTYEGNYSGFDMNGTYKIIIYAEDVEGMYSLPASADVVQTGISEKKGDLDGDRRITLKDLIAALKLMSGISVNLPVSVSDADVNNDGHIGAAEAVYILRRIAG